MNDTSYQFVSGIIFGLMTIGQLARLIGQIPVQVGTFNVPLWPSAIVLILALSMCIWAFRSASK